MSVDTSMLDIYPVMSTIRVLTAMEAEAAPMIERFGLTKEEPSKIAGPAPCIVYSGSYAGGRVVVVCNGAQRGFLGARWNLQFRRATGVIPA